MIRRFIAGLFLIYLSLWLGVAYLIECEITKFTDKGLAYLNLKTSGFPGAWRFDLTNPALTIKTSDETQIFSCNTLSISVSLGLKTIKIALDDQMLLETKTIENSQFYKIKFEPTSKLTFKFTKPIIFANNDYINNLSALKLYSDSMSISSKDEEIAFMEDTMISLKRAKLKDANSLSAILSINYIGNSELFSFDSLSLAYDGVFEYDINPDNQKIFLKKINIEGLELEINQASYIGLFGTVALSKDDIPIGKLDLELQNYSELIDLLWPNSFNMNAKEAKDIINEASDNQLTDEITLPIIFSDMGIIINGKNLKDLKGELLE